MIASTASNAPCRQRQRAIDTWIPEGPNDLKEHQQRDKAKQHRGDRQLSGEILIQFLEFR